MTPLVTPRRHLLLPWAVQEREDPVLEFERGEGVYFYDRQGRRYLDFLSQLYHCNLGHGNRRVIEAIQGQAERTCCVGPQLLTAERVQLAEALAQRAPGDLSKCFFVNSGSEADDQAFILARLTTGRPKIFAKYRSYHGTTLGGLGVAGDPRRAAIEPGPPVRFASSIPTAIAVTLDSAIPNAASIAWRHWSDNCNWRIRPRWPPLSSNRSPRRQVASPCRPAI